MFILRLLDLRAPSSHFLIMIYDLPKVRGVLTAQKDLSSLTWLRVGGPADWLFQPADTEDLSFFLKNLDPQIPVFPMGVGSNVIVRDGGLKAVVVRLSPRTFGQIEVNELEVTAGAGALDSRIAITAAAAGIDLTFFRTIPGSVGGALRMNAGCYGSYTADVFVSAQVVLRNGTITTLCANDLYFSYRNSHMPKGAVITSVTLRGGSADPDALFAKMQDQIVKRDATQPTKERSAGSTFKNPAGFSSTGLSNDVHDLKAWKVIDNAGLRGARLGGAQMSEKHSNFLINTGSATAADLEGLGEKVRKKVYDSSGITLEWEIMRVGDPA